ncbi:MAG: hypothetical protein HKN35_15805 [Woeseia sp.]|nr:hypothetical protein [Woeseia sp.]
MPLLKRIQTIAAKVEGTIGTAETLTASEGVFNAFDIEINADIELFEREGQGSFNYLTGTSGARGGSMTFKTGMEWDGAAHPAWASVLFPACGWVASGDVYTPRSEAPGANVKTVTLAVYQNGLRKMLAGAVGTFKIVCPSGELTAIEWEFTGVWQAVADVAILAPTYPTDLPLRFGSAVVTYQAANVIVENVTLDAGNEIILREDPATAAGYVSGLIVSRKPMITFNPEAGLVAADAASDPYGDWLAHTEGIFSCKIDGPTGANTNGDFTFSAPKAQVMNVQQSERNRLLTHDVELVCNKNAATADEEVSLTFTDAT